MTHSKYREKVDKNWQTISTRLRTENTPEEVFDRVSKRLRKMLDQYDDAVAEYEITMTVERHDLDKPGSVAP